MSKKNIYLFEISDVLANQAKLPYSTGLIWSYCIQEKKISENYNLDNWFWYKDDENTVDTIFNKNFLELGIGASSNPILFKRIFSIS